MELIGQNEQGGADGNKVNERENKCEEIILRFHAGCVPLGGFQSQQL